VQARIHPPRDWFDGYVFDLDGTVHLGPDPLPGAAQTLERIRASGRPVAFVSNNTTHSARSRELSLRRMGLPVPAGSVVTPAATLWHYLNEEGLTRVFVLAERPLRVELERRGIALVDRPEDVECVVAGFDRTLTYRKLLIAHRALERGARFIATNADRACPMPDGLWPDAAAVIGALEGSTGRRLELVLGKPSPRMIETALESMGVAASACLMIGDRLETDVGMAVAAGVASALVLTGAAAAGSISGDGPRADYVVASLDQVLPS
jgi:NagD protein